jgi:phosphatidylinositol alpha-1,6-mannosyltransferase
MRILMLDNEFPPLGGGTGVVNYYLLQEFAGYPEVYVDLVTSSRTAKDYETEQFDNRITIYKVPVDNRNIHHSTNRELVRYAWRGYNCSCMLIKKNFYDIGFAFAGVPAGVISYALKLRYGLPYLVSLQGPDVPGFEERYKTLYPFLKPVLRQVWLKAVAVTAISLEHQCLAYQTLDEIEIPIIYNGVDIETFHPGNHTHTSINILSVGRLIERKGQHHLLQAFACLCQEITGCQLQLTLAGTGDDESRLKTIAGELGISGQVHFLGFVPRQAMPDVYRQADIFVLPSQSEGMSIALLEAMASGLPVVVTNTGGTQELITPEKNGLVVVWADIEGLARALKRLVEDGNLRERMSLANRQTALKFSWSQVAEQYLDLLERRRSVSGL